MSLKKRFQKYNFSYCFSNAFSHNKIRGKKQCLFGKFVSLKSCSILCQTGNKLTISNHCTLHNCKITILGNNNYIYLDENVTICDTEITINANNCFISIGRSSSINESRFYCGSENNHIKIGDCCLVGFGCNFMTWDAHCIYDSNGHVINKPGNIEISNHVWISSSCTIFKNTFIQENTVIGARSFIKNSTLEGNSIYVESGRRLAKGINWSA